MTDVTTTAEARKFLKTAGTKVAIQCMNEGPYVFVEKGDFLATISEPYFLDYDGREQPAFIDGDVLHVMAGTRF